MPIMRPVIVPAARIEIAPMVVRPVMMLRPTMMLRPMIVTMVRRMVVALRRRRWRRRRWRRGWLRRRLRHHDRRLIAGRDDDGAQRTAASGVCPEFRPQPVLIDGILEIRQQHLVALGDRADLLEIAARSDRRQAASAPDGHAVPSVAAPFADLGRAAVDHHAVADADVDLGSAHADGRRRRRDVVGAVAALAGDEAEGALQGIDRELPRRIAGKHEGIDDEMRIRSDDQPGVVAEPDLRLPDRAGDDGIARKDRRILLKNADAAVSVRLSLLNNRHGNTARWRRSQYR